MKPCPWGCFSPQIDDGYIHCDHTVLMTPDEWNQRSPSPDLTAEREPISRSMARRIAVQGNMTLVPNAELSASNERVKVLEKLAGDVCWFDFCDCDSDVIKAVEALRQALKDGAP